MLSLWQLQAAAATKTAGGLPTLPFSVFTVHFCLPAFAVTGFLRRRLRCARKKILTTYGDGLVRDFHPIPFSADQTIWKITLIFLLAGFANLYAHSAHGTSAYMLKILFHIFAAHTR